MSVHAVRLHQLGGPEQLRFEEIEVGDPGPGQVRLRQEAIGLNYIDTYLRTGLYPLPELPAVLGFEAAGVVEEVGPDVEGIEVGDHVGYVSALGAYAEERLIDADKLVVLPIGITTEQAAAGLLKGLTAWYLLRRTYPVSAGDTILIHAAAGGVGSIVCQWAHALGATVIGTVGSEEKAQLAKANRCDHPIIYTEVDFVERVREITDGEGVPVVYDSVGKDTFDKSLSCLRPLGMMVSFGQSSGPIEPFDIQKLARGGSLFLTRPTLFNYTSTRDALNEAAGELFAQFADRAIELNVGQRFQLSQAREAHEQLHARKTVGSSILVP